MTKPLTTGDIKEQAKALAKTMKALGDYRRAMVFRWLAYHAAPVRFKALQEKSGIPAATLSKIVHKLDDVGLLKLTIGHDRSMTIEVNMDGLSWLTGFLLRAHQGLVKGTAAATKAASSTTTAT